MTHPSITNIIRRRSFTGSHWNIALRARLQGRGQKAEGRRGEFDKVLAI
ncbi:MAG: hypothetical protein F6K36_19385 [Symploca sp. SIO3C6]|uniref:Uncharacterized protein n=1 Tax=Symploca sp. SIO1C4 TaxID=2607765 RepID=A0A6B3NB56_9CYAN|nr:hypothetical protein [Symploca sp. SIO3C6]NER30339.1 hypothetical protein [Symploca sp. SIO1C4]